MAEHWFEDPQLVAQFPVEYRLLAWYSRTFRRVWPNREIRGLWRGWTTIARARSYLGAETGQLVELKGSPFGIDLRDPRALSALDEALGINAESRLLAHLLTPGDSFLDIGANHGAYSIVAGRLVGPSGRVIAFEPQPRLAGLLRRAFAAAGRDESDVRTVACSDADGTAEFFVPHLESGSAAMWCGRHVRRGNTFMVQTARLDTLLDGEDLPGRLVIKIDVEGAELAVVRGGERTLRSRRPPLVCEINPITSGRAGFDLKDLIRELVSLGYTAFSTPETYPRLVAAKDVELERQHNAVAFASPPR